MSRILATTSFAARTGRLRSALWTMLVLLAAASCPGCGKRPTTQPLATPAEEPAKPPAPNGDVTVELDEAEKAGLAAQAQRDLDETEAIIRGLDRERLSPEQQEKLRSVEGLVAAARAAGERDDVAAMANLARKARLLANELVPG